MVTPLKTFMGFLVHLNVQLIFYNLSFGNKIMNTIQRDGDISEVVATYSFLPNELIVFMNKGATRENMGRNLIVFANLKFKALTTAIEHLLIFVQPVIFSIIAIIIVILYLSILLPIYHSFQGVY